MLEKLLLLERSTSAGGKRINMWLWGCGAAGLRAGRETTQGRAAVSRTWSDWLRACAPSCFSRVRLCATLWTTDRQATLSVGFSRQEYWSGLPCPPPGSLPNSGIERVSLTSPVLASRFYHLVPSGKPLIGYNPIQHFKVFFFFNIYLLWVWRTVFASQSPSLSSSVTSGKLASVFPCIKWG